MITASLEAVAQAIKSVLEDARVELGLEAVWYGDQQLIGSVPAACVEPGPKERELEGAMLQAINQFTVFIILYHGKVADTQITRSECVQAAERLEDKLHEDRQLGGLVIHGHCTMLEPGYSERGALMYSTRITWTGISKTQL